MPKKTKYILAAILLGSFIIGWAAGVFFPKIIIGLFQNDKKKIVLADGTKIARVDRTTILLMGMDARKGETQTRTDTMILATIDKPNQVVSLLSIPRDTRVKIPGHGYQKINSANEFGGPELAQETVENLLGIPIDYYVMTNFEGFKSIIETIGGVTIDVEKNMYYRASDITINLKKGTQHLNAEKALQYARFRRDAMGDIGRTQRQQKVLMAVAKETLQAKNILKLPQLIPQFREAVKTNMPLSDMLSLAKMGQNLDPDKIATQTMPGNFLNYKGISYWYVDEDQAKQVAMAMLKGRDGAPVLNTAVSDSLKELQDKGKNKPVGIPTASAGETKPGQTVPGNAYGENNPGTFPGTDTGVPPLPEPGTQPGTDSGTIPGTDPSVPPETEPPVITPPPGTDPTVPPVNNPPPATEPTVPPATNPPPVITPPPTTNPTVPPATNPPPVIIPGNSQPNV